MGSGTVQGQIDQTGIGGKQARSTRTYPNQVCNLDFIMGFVGLHVQHCRNALSLFDRTSPAQMFQV